MIEFDLLSITFIILIIIFLCWRGKETKREQERKRGRESEKALVEGFPSDWKHLCRNINTIWSASYDSGFIESPTGQWFLIPVRKLHLRPCYKEILQIIQERINQMNPNLNTNPNINPSQVLKLAVTGTSGIGKNGFLQTLLLYLMHEAKEKGVVYSIRLRVFISRRNPLKDKLLLTDGRCSLYNDEKVDFYLSDSIDITSYDVSNTRIACVHATADDFSESAQLQKLPDIDLIPLPLWSYEELLSISPFSRAESDIRYAIFGGCARHFLGHGGTYRVSVTYQYVRDTLDWFFIEERTANVLSDEQWSGLCAYLVQCLSSANNKDVEVTKVLVKALMWHTDDGREFFYASRFMAMLAQHILTQHESHLKEAVRSLVTEVRIGYRIS